MVETARPISTLGSCRHCTFATYIMSAMDGGIEKVLVYVVVNGSF